MTAVTGAIGIFVGPDVRPRPFVNFVSRFFALFLIPKPLKVLAPPEAFAFAAEFRMTLTGFESIWPSEFFIGTVKVIFCAT